MITSAPLHLRSYKGFSLIEVVLAIGIFLVTVLALVGLLAPTLQSVDEVEKTDEVSSIVNTIDAFLHNSQNIAPGASKFNAIYNAVSQDHATLLVFRGYDTNGIIFLKIGFVDKADSSARVGAGDIYSGNEVLAAGTIYRVVLTPSSVNPDTTRADAGVDSYPRYKMNQSDPSTYPEGSFAMEVRIFAEDPAVGFDVNSDLTVLKDQEPIFTYSTAIVR